MAVLRVLYLNIGRVWLCQYKDDIRDDLDGSADMQVQCTVHIRTVSSLNPGTLASTRCSWVWGENVYIQGKTGCSVLSYETPLRKSWMTMGIIAIGYNSVFIGRTSCRKQMLFLYPAQSCTVQHDENPLLTCRDLTQGYHRCGSGSNGSVILLSLIGSGSYYL